MELAVQMDALGFDSVWTIEHHFTPYTMVTNPLQLLTYLAGVTRNVDLGSDVVVLPWHNPVRVAEALRTNPDAFRKGFLAGHPIGTPDEVVATSTALAEAFGADESMFIFKYGGLPLAEAERSVQLFADEVMPALQALDTSPLQPAA